MARVLKTRLAEFDLDEIWDYVARNSPNNATRLLRTINGKCEPLAEFPDMGRSRDDLEPSLRVFPVGKYAVCYRAISDGIGIVRVLHFSRDIEGPFESP